MSICAACGGEFSCGMVEKTNAESCWCVSMPPLQHLRPGVGCLCPKCLEARLAAERAAAQKRSPAAC